MDKKTNGRLNEKDGDQRFSGTGEGRENRIGGTLRVRNISRNRVLGDAIREAGTFFSRARGLLQADRLSEGTGLWIRPCRIIHSFGMRCEFDALFLDAGLKVVGAYSRFRRNRFSGVFWNARGVLELPAGTIEGTGTAVGDEIEFRT